MCRSEDMKLSLLENIQQNNLPSAVTSPSIHILFSGMGPTIFKFTILCNAHMHRCHATLLIRRRVQATQKWPILHAQEIKAKFHYASWFEAGRRQVRSWSATSFKPVCDQLRTSCEPDSVMKFGFYETDRYTACKSDTRQSHTHTHIIVQGKVTGCMKTENLEVLQRDESAVIGRRLSFQTRQATALVASTKTKLQIADGEAALHRSSEQHEMSCLSDFSQLSLAQVRKI